MRQSLVLLGLCVAVGCGAARPPPAELDGRWSTTAAACAGGVAVEFGEDAISAIYGRERQILFHHPRYEVQGAGQDFRVRITYDLPQLPGGARSAGAHGVLVLIRAGARLEPVSHTLIDPRTGAARMRISDDPAARALMLTPCDAHPWREALRGRTRL